MTLPMYLMTIILLAAAAIAHIFGMHEVFSNAPFSSEVFLAKLWQIILFGVPAVAFLSQAEKQLGKDDKSVFPRIFLPVSYVMLGAFLLVYLFGVQEAFSGSGYKDIWAFEALVYVIPGAFLLYASSVVAKKQGDIKSLMSRPLYFMGVIFVAATLISFVFGFNDFLYSDKQNMDWLIKTIAYLAPAGLTLYLAEKLK